MFEKKVIYPTSLNARTWQKNKGFGGSEFSNFASKIENLLSEFNVRFSDFEAIKKDICITAHLMLPLRRSQLDCS
jgi:hypothetical protein